MEKEMKEKINLSTKQMEMKMLITKKKTWVVIGSIALVAVIASLSVSTIFASSKGMSLGMEEVTILEKGTLTNAISATGTVESKNTSNIYSNLNYVVNKVNVEIGDTVSSNDVLCELDSSTLEDQIATKELSLSVSKKTAGQQLKAAQDTYNSTKSAIDNGTNSNMVSAKSSIDTSYDNWQKAKKTYEDYLKTIDNGTNTTLIQQNSAVESAQNAKETAETAKDQTTSDYNSAKAKTDAAKVQLDAYTPDSSNNQTEYDAAKTAYDGAIMEQNVKQSEYETAAAAYQSAQDAYTADQTALNKTALDNAKALFDTASSNLEVAKASSETLKMKLSEAEGKLTQNTDDTALSLKTAYESAKASSDAAYQSMKKAEKSLETAEDSYNYAVKTRDAAYAAKDTTLRDYAIAADNAYTSYTTAQKSYNAADTSVKSTLNSNENSVLSAQNSTDSSVAELELEQLRKDLKDTKITAGVSGVVTAVYAKVGSSGSGLLFVVEDTDHLLVDTSVKEYDIETVKPGMKVEIRSDATGDTIYQGIIETIAPTSNKTLQGETDKSGDIVFATKVSVSDQKTDLRIGMNVRLSYKIEEKENVLSVPYEAVSGNSGEEMFVLKLEKETEGYRIKKVNVTQELENDISIAISGENIKEGDIIINEPEQYLNSLNEIVDLTTEKIAIGGIKNE